MRRGESGGPFDRIRKLCLSLPETEEKLSHGEATFFVKKRVFVMFDNNHHHYADRLAVWCNAAEGAQEILVGSDPDNFFIPPYVGKGGWIGMRVDRDLPWTTISSVVKDAYAATCRAVASRRSSARRRSRA